MPFNVNQFIRKISQKPQPKVEVKIAEPPKEIVVEEPKQEIIIPVYVPESDSESEFSMAPVKRRVSSSFKAERKVELNPLSDS